MSLLCLHFPPLHLHSKTLIPHTADPPPARLLFRMKDRPPSAYGGIYVPPHHRFPSSNTVATASASNDSKSMNVTTQCDAEKRESFNSVRVTSNGNSEAAKSYPYLPPHHYQKQVQQQKEKSGREEVAQQVSDRPVVFSAQTGSLSSENANTWEWRLNALLHDNDKQEFLTFKHVLYSHLYMKVVVVSKFPLPDYRFDLDDKRPQREVIMAPGLQKRVDAYLVNYISGKQPLPHSKTAMEKIFWRRSMEMYEKQRNWQESPEGRNMMEFHRSLPAYKEKDAMLSAIALNQVVLISGETGCGKTTQIPQLILESEIDSLRGGMCNIKCTQPRKISAMSVSERIATERGEKLGETVSLLFSLLPVQIGYKVRLEGMKGRDTHLLFCSTGILLRRLSLDRSLKIVTHIIVDEIHERGINEDFLLIVLKDLLPRRPDLRLVLMSATLDEKLFSSYFSGAPRLHIPGFTYPVQTYFLESILEITGYKLTPHNQIDEYGMDRAWKMSKQVPRKRKSHIASAVEDTLSVADFKDYSAPTRESLSCWNPDCLGFNLIEYLLCKICENERPGSVLVFMTGWDDITALKDKLQAHHVVGDANRVLLLACHGSMGSAEQKLIFDRPPDGIRKVVLATNIAEISITIDDVVFVIDCGKAKEASYDALNNTSCLLPSWISKVSAKQRRGSAGRVQPGECYHLYPKCVFDDFAEYQLPEILRTPLQSLCLQIKSLKLGGISEFLSRALQSPEYLAVQNAIEYLKIIGALDESNCFGSLLDNASHGAQTWENAYISSPLDKKDLAEAAKAQFSHDFSDHLALVRAYEGWKVADKDLNAYEYSWKNFLSAQSMKAIDSLRKEFYSLLMDAGLVDSNPITYNVWSYDENLLRAAICYGLYPGICSVVHNERSFSLKTMEDGNVLLYSNSVNARNTRIPYPWFVFNEKIKVNSVFLRDSTAVSDSMILLFGGNILRGGTLLNPTMDIHSYHELISAIRLLISEDRCGGRFVFNPQLLLPSNPPLAAMTEAQKSASVHNTESGPGGDNSKSQLQTLLTRAGYAAPSYKTKQQKNSQFQSTVAFNGMEIMGKPCNNKKLAEKDAAAEALQYLLGGNGSCHDHLDLVSIMLKRSKKDHK
ncbi:hypothetical protein SASPL_125665 [Salvia splendens]|uniref:RNA helicase n=1 Tax=Salvia splendens TaxID=180675 RepID=A0A8X8XIY3_SALSN|nr:hypothetical protein SASPL_125665 [Salvia splendens]